MKINRASTIVLLSFLGLTVLILFQVHWLKTSANLLSEQFEQKVSKALAMTVLNFSEPIMEEGCGAAIDVCFGLSKESEQALRKQLAKSLAFYDIHLPFDFSIVDSTATSLTVASPYCCSLQYWDQNMEQFIHLSFPDKPAYIVKQMGFMLISSILILLFVTGISIIANLSLLRQKKLSARNTVFFNNMAHEFKTPLTNIILASKMLGKREPHLQQDAFLSVIQSESKRLGWQVERVLHLAKMEHGEHVMQKEPIDLKALVQDTLCSMQARLEDQQAKVELSIAEGLMIEADQFHLSNSIRNLIDNALKYNERVPQVSIGARSTSKGVWLQIQDNGIGISKNNQTYIFEPFQRATQGDLHERKGFGIGLAYVKKVMEMHAGFIKIASELNNGSRFDLFFPSKTVSV